MCYQADLDRVAYLGNSGGFMPLRGLNLGCFQQMKEVHQGSAPSPLVRRRSGASVTPVEDPRQRAFPGVNAEILLRPIPWMTLGRRLVLH